MQRITQEQYTDLMNKINNIIWRDNQRRKQLKQIQNNQSVFHNNDVRKEQMLKGKVLVNKYDAGYEEPYDQSEQENGK